MRQIFGSLLITLVMAMSIAIPVSAIDPGDANPCDKNYVSSDLCGPISDIQNPSEQTVWGLAKNIINWLLIAVGILAVIMIIISAIRITTSSGEPEKVKKGKSTLLWAVIGLALALGASLIIEVIAGISGDLSNRI